MITFNRFKLRLDGRISQRYSHGIHNNRWKTTPLRIEGGYIIAVLDDGTKQQDATSKVIREHYGRAKQYSNRYKEEA
jgi:hypothetical protein